MSSRTRNRLGLLPDACLVIGWTAAWVVVEVLVAVVGAGLASFAALGVLPLRCLGRRVQPRVVVNGAGKREAALGEGGEWEAHAATVVLDAVSDPDVSCSDVATLAEGWRIEWSSAEIVLLVPLGRRLKPLPAGITLIRVKEGRAGDVLVRIARGCRWLIVARCGTSPEAARRLAVEFAISEAPAVSVVGLRGRERRGLIACWRVLRGGSSWTLDPACCAASSNVLTRGPRAPTLPLALVEAGLHARARGERVVSLEATAEAVEGADVLGRPPLRRRELRLLLWRNGHAFRQLWASCWHIPGEMLGDASDGSAWCGAFCRGVRDVVTDLRWLACPPRGVPQSLLGARLDDGKVLADTQSRAAGQVADSRVATPHGERGPRQPRPLRVLVLAGRLPRRNVDGSWILCNLLRELAREHRVTLLALIDSPADADQASELIDAGVRVITQVRTRGVPASDPHHRVPPRLARDYSAPELGDAVDAVLRQDDFDVVQVEYAEMAHVVGDRLAGVPSVYTCHESLTLQHLRLWRAGPRPRSTAQWLRLWQAAAYEAAVAARFRRVVTLSSVDADVFRILAPAVPVATIPSAVELDDLPPAASAADESAPPTVLFVGYFKHPPNADGASWLAREVWPRLRRRCANARLRLVGGDPPPAILDLAAESVEVPGYVSDLAAELRRAAVVAVPIRLGGGLRGKVLEAWAAGKAVVATPIAAEGFGARDGEHLLLAQDAESFAEQLARCMQEVALRIRLGVAGRRLVEERFSAASVAARYTAMYHELLREAGGATAERPLTLAGEPAQ